jgi:hypothetical protein
MVALFAALTYTVSQGSRTGESQMTEKQAELAAVEILDYARNIKNAVHELQINGCDDTEVSFENAIISGYSNPNSPADENCHVFKPNGGGLRYTTPNEDWLDRGFLGQTNYQEHFFAGKARIIDIGTADTELIYSILFLKKEICEAINTHLSMNTPPEIDSVISLPFVGDYTPSATPDLGDEAMSLAGKNNFCFQVEAGRYVFLNTLIAR